MDTSVPQILHLTRGDKSRSADFCSWNIINVKSEQTSLSEVRSFFCLSFHCQLSLEFSLSSFWWRFMSGLLHCMLKWRCWDHIWLLTSAIVYNWPMDPPRALLSTSLSKMWCPSQLHLGFLAENSESQPELSPEGGQAWPPLIYSHWWEL